MKNNKRYAVLDIIKFLMAIVIIIYHYNYFVLDYKSQYLFKGGYLAVEIFFIISGFLFFLLEIDKKDLKKKSIVKCIKHKVTGLYPPYAFSLCVAFFISIVGTIKNLTLISSIKSVIYFIGDSLLISEWGIPKIIPTYNIITWYISAMILAFIIWLIIFKLVNKKFYFFITLLVTTILYIYIWFLSNNLHDHGHRTHILLTDGVLRAISGIGSGFISFYLYKLIKQIRPAITYLLFAFFGIGVFSILFFTKDSPTDFIIIPCAIIFIASAANFSILNQRFLYVSSVLGSFSYYIYLNHLIILNVMQHMFTGVSIYLYIPVVIIISALIMIVIKYILNKLRNRTTDI